MGEGKARRIGRGRGMGRGRRKKKKTEIEPVNKQTSQAKGMIRKEK